MEDTQDELSLNKMKTEVFEELSSMKKRILDTEAMIKDAKTVPDFLKALITSPMAKNAFDMNKKMLRRKMKKKKSIIEDFEENLKNDNYRLILNEDYETYISDLEFELEDAQNTFDGADGIPPKRIVRAIDDRGTVITLSGNEKLKEIGKKDGS